MRSYRRYEEATPCRPIDQVGAAAISPDFSITGSIESNPPSSVILALLYAAKPLKSARVRDCASSMCRQACVSFCTRELSMSKPRLYMESPLRIQKGGVSFETSTR